MYSINYTLFKLTVHYLILLLIIIKPTYHRITKDRNDKPYKVVCVWSSWSYYRSGDGRFTTDNINPNICTHLVYAFAKINPDYTVGVFDVDLDIGDFGGINAYRRFNAMRSNNTALTTMIAIGGWNQIENNRYSKMANTSETRKIFIDSMLLFLQMYGFDGIELTWEFAGRLTETDDKHNLVLLLEEMRESVWSEGYVVSLAAPSLKNDIDNGYNISEITKYVDFINLLAYDFHSHHDLMTGPNAPLFNKSYDTEHEQQLNVDFAVNYWISGGMDPKKIVLGLPVFGHTFTLFPAEIAGWFARIVDAGKRGNITQSPGDLGYNEICELLMREEKNYWAYVFDDDYKVPYIVKDDQFISYDDWTSIDYKLDYIISNGLAGAMVWSLDTDDFRGKCLNGSFPITTAVMNALNHG